MRCLLAAACLVAPVAACGQSVAPEAPVWYGWQIAVVDVPALALVAAGIVNTPVVGSSASNVNAPLVALGGVAYLMGGPMAHLAHGRSGAAFGSLGLRVGVPLVTGVVAAAIKKASSHCIGEDCFAHDELYPFALGAFIGAVGASIIDCAAIAREPPATRPAVSVALDRRGVRVVGTF